MPELPEVETTRCSLLPLLIKQKVTDVVTRHHQLRRPIPSDLRKTLTGQTLNTIERRAKYLLFIFSNGTLLTHLGMSGYLHLLEESLPPKKHDHLDIIFNNKLILRYTDPRRFGMICWITHSYRSFPLISSLGVEPLTNEFNGKYLYQATRHLKLNIKNSLMNNKIVVGIGNIYAAESLFQARIHPLLPSNQLSEKKCAELVAAIKVTLKKAIKAGGTTLKDFKNSEGKPGYFAQQLLVYGKDGSPCIRCGNTLELIKIGGRSTVYCPICQPLHP